MSTPTEAPAASGSRTRKRGIALAFAAAGISGVAIWLNGYAVKQVTDPAIYTTLKNVVAAVILIGLASMTGGVREARTLNRSQWARLTVVGLIGGSIPFVLFFTGLAQATAPGAAFIQKTMFVWVALLAVPFLGERLGLVQIGAMVVLLGGQLLLAPPRLDGAGWSSGETMIAVATLMWAVEVIIVKRMLTGISSSVIGAARLGIGAIFLVGYLAAVGSLGNILNLAPAALGWVLLTGVVLAGYVACWFAALRLAPASVVTSVLVVGAVITTALQALSGGAAPSTTSLLGGAGLVMAAGLLSVLVIRERRSTRQAQDNAPLSAG